MKRNNEMLILLYIVISSLVIALPVKGYYYNLIYLETDKELYYFNETIFINASWDLFYDVAQEISYMQFQIRDIDDNILWNTSRYYELGVGFEKNWTVPIENLNYYTTNISSTLYVEGINYFKDLNLGNQQLTLLKSIPITLLKKNITMGLIGFEDYILYGQPLAFNANFTYVEDSTPLINQSIEVRVENNNITTFEQNYKTNDSGIIYIFLDNLAVGENHLFFNISEGFIFSESCFTENVVVGKYPVLATIIGLNNNITIGDSIQFEVFYYYNLTKPLVNGLINIEIYSNEILKFTTSLSTNDSGYLRVNMNYSSIETSQYDNLLDFILTFNGSAFLLNKTISFQINVNGIQKQEDISSLLTEIIIPSILIPLIVFVFIVYKKKKRSNNSSLHDISFTG
jgi:hypothetical protein